MISKATFLYKIITNIAPFNSLVSVRVELHVRFTKNFKLVKNDELNHLFFKNFLSLEVCLPETV